MSVGFKSVHPGQNTSNAKQQVAFGTKLDVAEDILNMVNYKTLSEQGRCQGPVLRKFIKDIAGDNHPDLTLTVYNGKHPSLPRMIDWRAMRGKLKLAGEATARGQEVTGNKTIFYNIYDKKRTIEYIKGVYKAAIKSLEGK